MDAASESHAELVRNAAVGDFVELWQADRRAGVVRPLADYLARFPGQEAAIAREYANLLDPLPAVTATAIGTAEFAPYRLVRLLGHGGQGEVWLAEDARLGRQVALKVLTAPAPAMAGRVERLRREAQALARLEHPGICAIHEARLDGPRPWLAMQLVEGSTLAALLAQRDGGRGIEPHELGGWLEFFAAAAAALHAAHTLGILHRDIKPGNLMRTPAGAPVLLDFGLARDLEATAMALTQSGELFGTLPYMAPEVLAGRAADHRADVYALAVTMYEVLAGRRPFAGATQAALRQAIETGDPTALDRTVTAVGRDLAVVVATAMEREPARRYATAAAFAADLRAVQAGEPIAAVLPGRWVRVRRLVARHPALASSFVLLAIGLLVAMVLLTQLTRERTRLLALRQAHVARQIVAEQPGLALFAASEAARTAQHAEINDVIYQALDLCWEEHAVIDDWSTTAVESTSVDITEDDRWLVRAVRGGDLQVVDLERGRVVRTLPAAVAGRARVALAAGDALLCGGADGVLRQLDLVTGAGLHAWSLHAPAGVDMAAIAQLVVAPDRRRIASCGADGRAAVVDLDGRLVATCLGHAGSITMATFAPDGRRLATLGGKQVKLPDGDRCVRVFATDSGELLHSFGPYAGHPHWLAWSHDGSRLAIAVDANHIAIHDLARGTVAEVPNPSPAQWIGFSADDSVLVIASRHGLRVLELASGRLLRVHEDFHGRSVFRGAFSPDGERFAVIAWDDTARLYDTATWQLQRVYRGVTTRPRGMGWNRRGDRLYTVGGCLQSWYIDERPFLPHARGLPGRLVSARFAPQGDRIVAANATGALRIWDAEHCRELAALEVSAPLLGVRWLACGERLLAIGDGVPSLVLRPSGDRVPLGAVPARAGFVLAGDRIALASADGCVRVHDAASGAERLRVPCHDGPIVAAALHPTRPWLATGGSDRRYAVVDLERGQLLHRSPPWRPGTLGTVEMVLALSFAAASDELWVSCEDQFVRVVELGNEFRVRSLDLQLTPGPLLHSADADSVYISAMWSGKLYRYGARDLKLRDAHPARHANMLVALQLQPGGRLALSASRDGVVSVFDADRDLMISVIHATSDTLVAAEFSPNGTRILTADAAGAVRVWPLDPLAVALRHRPMRLGTELEGR